MNLSLIELLDPVEFALRRLHFTPDETQARILRSNSTQGLLNCARQWGKSTITAIKALHTALSNPRQLILVASPTERQSAEFIRKCRDFLLPLPLKLRGDGANRSSLLLPNHSRIVGLPGREATIRGFSNVALLLIDEAAQAPDSLYLALRPMLAMSRGSLWLLSTPKGARGFFWEEWTRGDGWERIAIPAWDCPRYDPAFLDRERASMPGRWFQQEYGCAFMDDDAQVFSLALLESVACDEPPLIG